jgi:hypothetical protein
LPRDRAESRDALATAYLLAALRTGGPATHDTSASELLRGLHGAAEVGEVAGIGFTSQSSTHPLLKLWDRLRGGGGPKSGLRLELLQRAIAARLDGHAGGAPDPIEIAAELHTAFPDADEAALAAASGFARAIP